MLAYQNLDIIRKSIDALAPLAAALDVQIIENPSDASAEIHVLFDEYLKSGLVTRCFLFEQNISNNAIEVILRREIDFASHEFILITDCDLLPLDNRWFEEERSVLLRHVEVFCVGGTLDMANLPVRTFPEAGSWIPPDMADHGGYIEALTGAWFLMFRGAQLGALMAHLATHKKHFRDAVIAEYCYERLRARWARTRRARFVHLTWDLYHDAEHPYTRFKREVPFHVHWDHERYAPYRMRECRRGRLRTSDLRNAW